MPSQAQDDRCCRLRDLLRELPDAAGAALAALPSMTIAALRAEWRRLYRHHPPAKLRRDTLELAVAWQLQAQALGGVPAPAKRRLGELAGQLTTGSDLPRARRVVLKPGARLVRQWGGETHEVLVTEHGFVWRERSWKSLSVIAREMTGTRWSGPRFFGVDRSSKADRGREGGEGAGAGR